MHAGGIWSGDYYAFDLSEFRWDVLAHRWNYVHPQRIKEITHNNALGYIFPLRKMYNKLMFNARHVAEHDSVDVEDRPTPEPPDENNITSPTGEEVDLLHDAVVTSAADTTEGCAGAVCPYLRYRCLIESYRGGLRRYNIL